ncbi:MAG: hypothetical protein ACI3VN_11240 [Candidatus Onthomonas sp.]
MDDVYQYEFANGDVVSVPLSEEWATLLRKLDRQEENNNQMERRRHCSLEWYNRYDNRLPQHHDAFEEVEERDTWDQMCRYLTRQETLIGDLYFRKGFLQQEIADCLDLSQGRVAQTIQRIRKIFQQIFDSS